MSDIMLDKYFPPRGPCAFCGHKDARHRLFDAILDRYFLAHETIDMLADDYNLPKESIELVIAKKPYHPRTKKYV